MIKISERYNTLKEFGIDIIQCIGKGTYDLKKDDVTISYNNVNFLYTSDIIFFADVINSFRIYGVILKKEKVLNKKEIIRKKLIIKGLINE